jgi:hypothetical protein
LQLFAKVCKQFLQLFAKVCKLFLQLFAKVCKLFLQLFATKKAATPKMPQLTLILGMRII